MSRHKLEVPPVNSIPDYQYEELRSPDEIRLITIVPGDFEDDIVVRVSHDWLKPPPPAPPRMSMRELAEALPPDWEIDETEDGRFIFIQKVTGETFWDHPDSTIDLSRYIAPEIDHEPKYEALSYTWGDMPGGGNSSMTPVYIQMPLPGSQPTEPGSRFAKLLVTSNLAIALRHLRLDTTRTLPVWIDAISINQGSIPERNTQVLRMTDIYRLAHQIIIWLGPSSSSSRTAVGSLSRLGKQFVTSRKRLYVKSPDTEGVLKWGRGTALPYNNDTWAAIEEFFNRAWFRRLWVVQEIQLARNAVVYCGIDNIPWDWLWQAANFIFYNDYTTSSMQVMAERVKELGSKTCGIRSSIETAYIAGGRLCTDPRDSVYGLVGIFPSGLRGRIQPNYEKEVWEVFRDFMMGHIDVVERLEMLAWCSSREGKRCENGWPSWVPNIQEQTGSLVERRQFATSYSRCWVESCENPGIKGKRPSSILRAKGVQCGTVIRAENPFTARSVGLKPVAEALRALVLKKDKSEGCYVTGESWAHAAAKVLCASRYKQRCPDDRFPKLEIWQRALFPSGWRTEGVESNSDKLLLEDYPRWIGLERCLATELSLTLPCILETSEGYVGFGPVDTQAGDIISVLLGCATPMLIRPNPDGDTYMVVGPVYVYGLNDANALLDPLPEPWKVQIFQDRAGNPYIYRFFNPETGELSDEDPRLDPLPDEWVRIRRDRTEDDPSIFQCFTNTRTGETINHDPRMSPEALIGRGVDIRTFCLA